jgi:ABC-type multidrug transport system fused ATPase/permease subunit
MLQSVGARLRRATPRQILVAGWLAFMVYAYPGYMSFDSVFQLNEARTDHFSDQHPPAMAELWRLVDGVITGPIGMLVIQSTCFLAGVFLLFRHRMQPRTAAIAAVAVFLFPPISRVMAVIWKDAQMTAFLILGTALILEDRRRRKVAGLVLLAAGTAMRHNALVMTFPIVVMLFSWNAAHRFWKRYALAFAAWCAVTGAAQLVTRALTDEPRHVWATSFALCDITSTLRYVEPTIPDDELRTMLAGTRILPKHDLHAFVRERQLVDWVNPLWDTAYAFFAVPATEAERAAMTKAWRNFVPSHLGAYLTYRWEVFKRVLELPPIELASPVYDWFSDVQDIYGSADKIGHDAAPGQLQNLMRAAMDAVGATWLFYIMLYVALTLLLLLFSLRDREVLALIVSGIFSEVVLFVIAPTTDWRYSFWMVLAAVLALVMLVARRYTAWLTVKMTKQKSALQAVTQ